MKRIMIGAVGIVSALALAGCGEKENTDQNTSQEVVQEQHTGLIDLTQMSEVEKVTTVADILDKPDTYEGCIIKVDGKNRKFRDELRDEDFYVCLTTYADDEEPEGLAYVLANSDYPKNGEMITITGILTNYSGVEDGVEYEYTELRDTKIVKRGTEDEDISEENVETPPEKQEDLIYDFGELADGSASSDEQQLKETTFGEPKDTGEAPAAEKETK